MVADEVRALAYRTQQSTQEIEQMVQGMRSGSSLALDSMQASAARATTTLALAERAGRRWKPSPLRCMRSMSVIW